MTDARQLRARAVVQLARGQNLVGDARGQAVQLARQILDRLPQDGRGLALREQDGAPRQSLLAQPRQLKNLQGLKRRALYPEARDSLRGVGRLRERPGDAAPPQLDALCKRAELASQPGEVVNRRQRLDARAAHGRLRPALKKRERAVVFECGECLFVHNSGVRSQKSGVRRKERQKMKNGSCVSF